MNLVNDALDPHSAPVLRRQHTKHGQLACNAIGAQLADKCERIAQVDSPAVFARLDRNLLDLVHSKLEYSMNRGAAHHGGGGFARPILALCMEKCARVMRRHQTVSMNSIECHICMRTSASCSSHHACATMSVTETALCARQRSSGDSALRSIARFDIENLTVMFRAGAGGSEGQSEELSPNVIC